MPAISPSRSAQQRRFDLFPSGASRRFALIVLEFAIQHRLFIGGGAYTIQQVAFLQSTQSLENLPAFFRPKFGYFVKESRFCSWRDSIALPLLAEVR